MDVATPRPLSAADLNFNPARFPRGQLADFARAHWGVDGRRLFGGYTTEREDSPEAEATATSARGPRRAPVMGLA